MCYYKLFEKVYDKTTYKDMIFVSENLWINTCLFICIRYFHKLKNKSIQTGSKTVGGIGQIEGKGKRLDKIWNSCLLLNYETTICLKYKFV
jgi:hypothetical protein